MNDLKDSNHLNIKLSGVNNKQLSSLFSDQANYYPGQQPHGINGFVNGQGLLPNPPSPNKNINHKNQVLVNGEVDINERRHPKTEGHSTRLRFVYIFLLVPSHNVVLPQNLKGVIKVVQHNLII